MAGVQIIITMDEQMQISVEGPLEHRVLCLGMLQVGIHEVEKKFAQALNKIQPASAAELSAVVPGRFGR